MWLGYSMITSKKLQLNNVTLVAMGSTCIEGNVKALKHSMVGIDFGAVRFVTSATNAADHFVGEAPIEVLHIDPITSIDQWNHEIVYRLGRYVDTDYAILVHPDGFIVHPENWRSEFLDYDYVGSPWPYPVDDYSYRDINGEIIRVGNSVSLRSKRLMDLAPEKNLEWRSWHGFYNEDGYICVNQRHHYLNAGMNFAPIEVAKFFGREWDIPESMDVEEPFLFHGHNGRNAKYPNYEK